MLEISIIFPIQLEKLKLRKGFPYTTMGGGGREENVPPDKLNLYLVI